MRYFDTYVDLIESGKIPVCREIKLAVNRIQRYKEQYIFKQEEADKRIKFIENECSNTKGLRTKLKLALPQKVWLEVVFGFYHNMKIKKTNSETLEEYEIEEERRLIHEVPIIVSRGCGKTTLAAAIAMIGQICDGEYGADVQCLAYNREQAGYLFNASRAMTSYEDSLLFLMKKVGILTSTRQGMMYSPTNSLLSIKTSDYEALDGTNAHYNIFDEVATYDDDFIKVVNDGSSRKRKNWVTWYISTNGTKRNKVFDSYYNTWVSILEGGIDNDSVMPFIYKLDDISEVHDSDMWMKAVPMLGITVEKEAIALDIETSNNNPVIQTEILAKTFNLQVNNYLAYFSNDECKGNKKSYNSDIFIGNDERNARAVIGVDLSDVGDICSISFMIVDGDNRYFLNKKYMPRRTVEDSPKDQKDKYLEWESQGHLHIHEKDYNEQDYIFEDLRNFMIENNIMPVKVGFDRWNSRQMIRLFEDYYGDVSYEVSQTVKVLSAPLKIFKEKAKSGKIIFSDPVATWCMSNVRVKVDHNNNIFPSKEKAKDKIDVFASMLDAFICYENNREELTYYFE
jgi:phage terminase large subunit-like protein